MPHALGKKGCDMSDVVAKAVATLQAKLGTGFEGVAKFVLEGEGTIIIDAQGVRAGDGEADVTFIAKAEVFEKILSGEMGATGAFMSGKLKVDGSMPMAMQLGNALI
jgi:putative sterol carrier protein